jgi:hypothetical protein
VGGEELKKNWSRKLLNGTGTEEQNTTGG